MALTDDVFVTEYALAPMGIARMTLVYKDDLRVCLRPNRCSTYTFRANSPNLFRSMAEAVQRAEVMRTEKIAALRKEIAELEALTFEPAAQSVAA